jgi:hypothetical protein
VNAELANPPTCERCDGKRVIKSAWSNRRIRCPMCTHRKPDKSGKHLRTLTESLKTSESLKFTKELASKVAMSLVERFNFPNLPEHLVGTDRVLQRWAAASSGMPSDNPDLYFKARHPPLDDKTQEKVSDVVKASPQGMRTFIADWYRFDVPTPVMAENRHMSVRSLNREWQNILVDLRARFLASDHPDLTTLIRQLP